MCSYYSNPRFFCNFLIRINAEATIFLHLYTSASPLSNVGYSASTLISMAGWWPSSRSSTSFGGPHQPCAGAHRCFSSKWFVPGAVEMADAVDSSSEWRTPRAASSLISVLCILRSPACGGDGARALDCFSYFIARVLFVYSVPLLSNFRFSRAKHAKGHHCNLCTHRF
jgi:hypothetical protein